MKFDELRKGVMPTLSNRKYQWIATIAVLFIVLMVSSSVRMSNWDLLTDSTTGEKIPLALDPYYFLRIAQTIVETDGNLGDVDEMRAPGFDIAWHHEIMPQVIVMMWRAGNVFGDYSLETVDVFSPMFFYFIGVILFFLLILALTDSKGTALLSSVFLAFIPAYLYRTMAGFSDHESIGMVGFYTALLGFVWAMKRLEKMRKFNWKISVLLGVAAGLLSIFSIFCWSGVAVLLFMILPICFGIFWVIRTRSGKSSFVNNGLVFYLSWIGSCIVLAIIFGVGFSGFVNKYMLSSTGIFSAAILGFVVIDKMFMMFDKGFSFYDEKYRLWYVLGSLFVLGGVGLGILGENIFSMIWEVLNKMLNPSWNTDRAYTTVAENAQPYLTTWISNSGSQIFWLFVAGMVWIAWNFSKGVSSIKRKWFLFLGSLAMIFGILFSRISSDSILNGSGIFTFSGLIYLGGIVLFVWAFLKNYFDGRLKIYSGISFLLAWMIVVLVVGRSTTRLFFVIAPFMCFCAAYFIIGLIKTWKDGKLDDVSRVLVVIGLIVSVLTGGYGLYVSYLSDEYQAQYTGPSADDQWQSTMSWVRNNTAEDSIFIHWWDYGYWVQTLGERATVADGGHAETVYDGDFKIGRYVLTTPFPETALSFFKTISTDYLLIDQSDLGKYGAYSLIGGGNDDDGEASDRYSGIPILVNDESQTYETANGTVNVFTGGSYLYEDITYVNENGVTVFLPSGKAVLMGIVMSVESNSLIQPEAVYYYNGVQTRIPIRYVYFRDELIDFGSGLEVVVDVIPAVTNGKIATFGAAIYLSQKVQKSLFARLYLLNDSFDQYGDLVEVHSEDDEVVAMLKAQGIDVGDFVYYSGFRGPIKIWDVSNISDSINVVEEFKDAPVYDDGAAIYGTLDELDFGSI